MPRDSLGSPFSHRVFRSARAACGPVLPTAALALSVASGCTESHGVDVINATDRTVNAELLTIDPSGEMTGYGRAVVNPGGAFKNRMSSSVRGQSMRVRFTLDGETVQDENWVLLHLPRNDTRFYELRVTDGRLHVDPQKRGRPETIKVKE